MAKVCNVSAIVFRDVESLKAQNKNLSDNSYQSVLKRVDSTYFKLSTVRRKKTKKKKHKTI